MWKKLLAAILTGAVLAAPASAHTVACQSLTAADDGTRLAYQVTNTGAAGRVDCIAALYSQEGQMLSARVDSAAVAPGASASRQITFPASGGAYAKVFPLLGLDTLAPGGEADRINTGSLYDFSQEPWAGLGKLTADCTVGGVTFHAAKSGTTDFKVSEGCLSTGGAGGLDSRSVTIPVAGPCTVEVVVRSGGESGQRPLQILTSAGKVLSETVISTAQSRVTCAYAGPADRLTFCSGLMNLLIYSIRITYAGSGQGAEEPPAEVPVATGAGTVDPGAQHISVTGWDQLKTAVTSAPDGAVLQLKSGVIPCGSNLRLTGAKRLTIQGSDDAPTILDFSAWSDTLMNSAAEVATHGIDVTGSNITLKNFIIQGTPGTAINLTGASCGNILLENIVARYNHNSGFYVQNGAHDVTLRCCDSYRNCDIYKKGQDADGFSISISCGDNLVLDNCRAFENADDAYDNFNNHHKVYYLDCYCWNNGGIDVYTGQYNVDRGEPVDRNLPLVRWMYASSPEYRALLDSAPGGVVPPGSYVLPTGLAMTIRSPDKSGDMQTTLGKYITQDWEGNGNGFKLASGYQSESRPKVEADAYRCLERCIAFDNGAKGFDQNNGSPTVDASDFFSFKNKQNYLTAGLTPGKLSNLLSYLGERADNVGKFPVQALDASRAGAMESAVRARAGQLMSLLDQDLIPGRFIIDPGW